jgi:glycosyltransferase involved in cell wall biosynthesis
MVPHPLISVVIPAHQAEETIDRCLDALAQQTVPRASYEVIVVDDGSTDGTRARVQAQDDVCLVTQSHAGPAAARNLGIQQARGKIVLFTDADCQAAPDWVERMVGPFREDSVAGVKGAYLTCQPEIVARFAQMEYEDRYDRMVRYEFIDFVDTYAAGYRRDLLLSYGGFDPALHAVSVEDQELSFRLAEKGHKMVFEPRAQVYHLRHPPDVATYFRRKFRIGYWKVKIARRYPGKLLQDSHTPQVLKVQILLVGLGVLSLLGTIFWPALGWGLLLAGLLFLISTLPFVLKGWRKDAVVALLSPMLLLVRAVALGTGFLVGLGANLRPSGDTRGQSAVGEGRD